jgi:hypothetical protein
MATIDYRRVTLYPPEVLIDATPINLQAGANRIFDYVTINVAPEYILSLYGLSLTPLSGATLTINADGISGVATSRNCNAFKGLDYEEDFKIAAYKTLTGIISTTAPSVGYAWRHKILVQRINPLAKLINKIPLNPRDIELVTKFDLADSLASSYFTETLPYSGLYRVITETVNLAASGTVLRRIVPDDEKLVLLDVGITRAAVGNATISIARDDTDTMSLDTACLQDFDNVNWNGSRPERTLFVNCLKKLEVTLDVSAGGPYDVRVVYGLAKLSVRDKIRWKLELSTSDKAVADKFDLYDKVEAGI